MLCTLLGCKSGYASTDAQPAGVVLMRFSITPSAQDLALQHLTNITWR